MEQLQNINITIKNPVITTIHKNTVKSFKPSEFKEGQTIEGTFLFKRENVGNYGGESYIIDPKLNTGEYYQIFSCTSLKNQMEHVNPLEIIKITYTGSLPPEKDKKFHRYCFEVEYIEFE